VNWTDDLGPQDRAEWQRFVEYQHEHTVKGIESSACVMSLVPDGEPDIKFAVELGLAIMLGKPVIAVAMPGSEVPSGLRKVAAAVIEDADLDTGAGRDEFARQLKAAMDRLEDQ
jgi:nucleoside 2-deoxyribosyltransferase